MVSENHTRGAERIPFWEFAEAVLQAPELITRGEAGFVWIKPSAMREKAARLIGQPVEKMGDAQ